MSVLFDAAPDRLLRTATINLTGYSHTHMGYIKCLGATGGLQTLTAFLDDDLNPYVWFGLLANGSFYAEDSLGGGGDFGVDIVYNEWTHVTFTRTFNAYGLWLDGAFIGALGGVALNTTISRYECGGWRTVNGNRFNGYQGAMKAFTEICSDAKVAAEYGFAEAQDPTNLFGVWPLLTDVDDYSGNDNHWTASGLDYGGAIPGVDYGAFGGEEAVINQVMLHRRQLCY